MAKEKHPVTQAVRALRAAGIAFTPHSYDYVSGGGTAQVAAALGVDEHLVVKTLIMEDADARPLVVLMHGDRQVATQHLARAIGSKRVRPCAPEIAERHSGYRVGGTSPFGTRHPMPVYCERGILELPQIYINGGKRGFIIAVETRAALQLLQAQPLDLAVAG
ncbi:membrane protein [Marichromatium purpuratum 984]|uniref:Cys-tRNA(Pro)/Cys-tRNA(Cys) deacylase n=1 Tax=Marichromatium purpuratum 984 TaxID=765910 RepID=W0DYS8_MARPU|nr:aminoacyl-tRNA deacylase [Marichromatium purpuratum]AHF03607.1 membrane protein [Marichromatium purpuratum 984]